MNDTLRYIDVQVPMDLIGAMQKKGLIGDINYGINICQHGWGG